MVTSYRPDTLGSNSNTACWPRSSEDTRRTSSSAPSGLEAVILRREKSKGTGWSVLSRRMLTRICAVWLAGPPVVPLPEASMRLNSATSTTFVKGAPLTSRSSTCTHTRYVPASFTVYEHAYEPLSESTTLTGMMSLSPADSMVKSDGRQSIRTTRPISWAPPPWQRTSWPSSPRVRVTTVNARLSGCVGMSLEVPTSPRPAAVANKTRSPELSNIVKLRGHSRNARPFARTVRVYTPDCVNL
mmetsp:Transcript_6464/g.16336  ORF Transcript_6464/g.16336 Transcript_6464/m.16336 type:complete len:243 (-) Transcript_6464:462-1190(-)